MASQLEQLKKLSVVVADTGDINSIKQYQPQDATTNPSIILNASKLEEYQPLLQQAVAYANSNPAELWLENAIDYLSALIGNEIAKIVPGYVSTEVDARLSYDTEKTIARAKKIIALYKTLGLEKERILIKIAATWQGIKAAEQLEKEGISCNLTLLFSFAQAQACADANVTLISPFVGRILDFFKQKYPTQDFSGTNDPGVISVTKIYNFYKQYGIKTIVMGASFRTIAEITDLAGCDRLTIAPALLKDLAESDAPLEAKLKDPQQPQAKPAALTEAEFYWNHNLEEVAVVKLAEGIKKFSEDLETLEQSLLKLK